MMLKKAALWTLASVLLISFCAHAKEAAPPKTAKGPADKAAPKVVATVGKTKIMSDQVDKHLAGAPKDAPPARLAAARKRIIGQMVENALFRAHINALPCTEKDIDELKKDIAEHVKRLNATRSKDRQVTVAQFMAMQGITKKSLPETAKSFKFRKQVDKACSGKAIEAYIKASPVAYFDGTQVQASHILLTCSPHSAPEEKKKIKDKLQQIAKEISDKKISFADAAKKSSTCPSAAEGGDLGSFTYDRMVAPFSVAAFAMKVGQVSDVVETQFGYHIIKLTKRTPGSGKAGPSASRVARQMLMANFHAKTLAEARKTHPVKIIQ